MTDFCQTVSKCNTPPAAEIQKSWGKVDFSMISRNGRYTTPMGACLSRL